MSLTVRILLEAWKRPSFPSRLHLESGRLCQHTPGPAFLASPGEWTAVSAHTRPCLPGFTCRARPCLPGFTCRANGCVSARPALLLGALWLCGPTLMTSAVLLPPLPPFGCSSQVESSAPEATLLKVPCTLALDGDCRGTVVARQGKAWGPR